MACYSYRIK